MPVLAVYVTPPSPHRPPWQESETADEPIEETEATYEALKALNTTFPNQMVLATDPKYEKKLLDKIE